MHTHARVCLCLYVCAYAPVYIHQPFNEWTFLAHMAFKGKKLEYQQQNSQLYIRMAIDYCLAVYSPLRGESFNWLKMVLGTGTDSSLI